MAYSNMIQTAQSTVRNLLYNNRPDPFGDIKVLDGVPPLLMKGIGFPYVIVHTPTTDEERLTMGQNPIFMNIITMEIEIWAKKESVARELADVIRNLLKTKQDTTRAVDMYLYNIDRSSLAISELPAQGKPTVYTITLSATYNWYGA